MPTRPEKHESDGEEDDGEVADIVAKMLENSTAFKDKPMSKKTKERLSVKLMPHQVQGMWWMRDHERNPQVRGGILGDDMGLGKTIQAISLMVSRPMKEKDIPEDTSVYWGRNLVLCPSSLMKQWKSEIKNFVINPPLKVRIHHGSTKIPLEEMHKYHVVITSYDTAANENNAGGGVSQAQWHRVITDEAHSFRNRMSLRAKACSALKSKFRWCLTGTPIQNSLEDLFTLLVFLKFYPYKKKWTKEMQRKWWTEEIQDPIKRFLQVKLAKQKLEKEKKKKQEKKGNEGGATAKGKMAKNQKQRQQARNGDNDSDDYIDDPETEDSDSDFNFIDDEDDPGYESGYVSRRNKYDAAVKRLRSCVQLCMLMRKKKDVSYLPIGEVTAHLIKLSFTPPEQEIYERLEGTARERMKKMMRAPKESEDPRKKGVLALLLADQMRRSCDHFELLRPKKTYLQDLKAQLKNVEDADTSEDDASDDKAFEKKLCHCYICQIELKKWVSEPAKRICPECLEFMKKAKKGMIPYAKEDEETATRERLKRKERQEKAARKAARENSKLKPKQQSEAQTKKNAGSKKKRQRNANPDAMDVDTSESTDIDPGASTDERGSGTDPTDTELESEDAIPVGDPDTEDDDEEEEVEDSDEEEDDETDEEEVRDTDEEEDDIDEDEEADVEVPMPSTKIMELMKILRNEEVGDDQFIIFSSWIMMLDLVQPFLRREGITCVRYTGSMSQKQRGKALSTFKRPENAARVLLCSLKCGNVGLNLMNANRVVLLEPFWNPTVEAQAIGRVDRIGQKKEVVVYRLTIPHTFEDDVRTLQRRKLKLANDALGGDGNMTAEEILRILTKDSEESDEEADAGARGEPSRSSTTPRTAKKGTPSTTKKVKGRKK